MTYRRIGKGLGALALVAGLGGCVPVDVYHKTGAAPGAEARDLADCEVVAAREVSVDMQLRQSPIYRGPPLRRCFGLGGQIHCHLIPGHLQGGQVYSYDANARLRQKKVTQCMLGKGYELFQLPQCTSDQVAGRMVAYDRMPPVREGACVTRAGGRWYVVNP